MLLKIKILQLNFKSCCLILSGKMLCAFFVVLIFVLSFVLLFLVSKWFIFFKFYFSLLLNVTLYCF